MSYYNDYPQYVPGAVKKKKALKQIEKLRKKRGDLAPILLQTRTIAGTWWGKAWNKNLESYADYANRLARGRSYIRNNAVLHLEIDKGLVNALVQGSRSAPYQVKVEIAPLSQGNLNHIADLCRRQIDDFQQLVEGNFPKELAAIFTEKGRGLFPSIDEIQFNCSCPDWATMCKHVAAVLYGIGARFDEDPALFFKLRDVDFAILIKKTVHQKMESLLANAGKPTPRTLDDEDVAKLFGI